LGTNHGSPSLAFQGWHHFKEAFSPEFVRRALSDGGTQARRCLDPFGGSGTTALTSQLLGVASTTVEVNPFLADVIRAKVASYDVDRLGRDFTKVLRIASQLELDPATYFADLPASFIEPGTSERWLFDSVVARELAALLDAIDRLKDEAHRRLFRVLLGGLLVDVSNVSVSGKGRRYRRAWSSRKRAPGSVATIFRDRVSTALADVYRFSPHPAVDTNVIEGDARHTTIRSKHDIAVFSPPYPNSFDYTDVYNVELWMLGYLSSAEDNRALRSSTLASHVQLKRSYRPAPPDSPTLKRAVGRLSRMRSELWSPWIPDMVGGYFSDLLEVLRRVRGTLRTDASCWLVVGDSRYGGVNVSTAKILEQLAAADGWRVDGREPFRAMRASPQHGGRRELPETLLRISNAA
jgi:hypothetical protein